MERENKKLVLIGAGKIGKGYIADLFNEAGWDLVFLCRSLKQAEELRNQGYYTLFKYYDDGGDPVEERIENFEAYSTESEYDKSIAALVDANYATVHLYPSAFASVGHMIGDAIKERVRQGKRDTLDVILCLNFIDPQVIIQTHIEERLETEEEWAYYRNNVGIVLALTFRWGGNPRAYMVEKDPLCSCVAESPDLPVDKDAFKGPIPSDVKLRPLGKMRERLAYKVWGGNVNHYIMSLVAYHKGMTYTYEAESDKEAVKVAELGTREAHFGFDHEFSLTQSEKDENMKGRKRRHHVEEKIEVECPEELPVHIRRDELTRVAADPARKLARRDRLMGPAISCMKNGKVPYYLTRAAAYAFLFDPADDSSAVEIQAFIKENGVDKAVEHFCQLDLTDRDEAFIYQMVLAHYYEIIEADPFEIAY